jgi:hypothetical protein
MNYNIACYVLYGCVTVFIIYRVGQLFHRNGRIFILRLFQKNENLTNTTNNILLLDYYLFNTGYAAVQFSFWERVLSLASLIGSVATKTGILVIILACTHYCNLYLIYYLSMKKEHLITSKNYPP